MRKTRKPKGSQRGGTMWLQVDQPAPRHGWLHGAAGQRALELQVMELAPYEGWLTPGEEVTGLPGGP